MRGASYPVCSRLQCFCFVHMHGKRNDWNCWYFAVSAEKHGLWSRGGVRARRQGAAPIGCGGERGPRLYRGGSRSKSRRPGSLHKLGSIRRSGSSPSRRSRLEGMRALPCCLNWKTRGLEGWPRVTWLNSTPGRSGKTSERLFFSPACHTEDLRPSGSYACKPKA